MNISRKRVHFLAVVDEFFKWFKFLWPTLFLFKNLTTLKLIIFIAIMTVVLIFCLVDYYFTTYEIKDGVLIYRHGFLVKEARNIPLDKIESLDTEESFYYQIFGVAKLDINLLQGKITIKPLAKKELSSLMSALNQSVGKVEQLEKDDVLYSMSDKDLVLWTLLKIRPIAIFGVMVAFANKIDSIISFFVDDRKFLRNFVERNISFELLLKDIGLLIITILSVIVVSLVVFAIYTVVKFKDFEIVKDGDMLLCTYGLTNKKKLTIDINKIQSVKIEQNLRYKFLGLAKLDVVTLSEGVLEDITQKSKINIIPYAKESLISDFIKNNLVLDVEKYTGVSYEKVGVGARFIMLRWKIIKKLALFTAIAIFIQFFDNGPTWLNLALAIIFVLLVIVDVFKVNYYCKNAKNYFEDDKIINVTASGFTKIIEYINVEKINSVHIENNIFMKRKNLAHILVNSIGSDSDISLDYYSVDYGQKIRTKFIGGDSL